LGGKTGLKRPYYAMSKKKLEKVVKGGGNNTLGRVRREKFF